MRSALSLGIMYEISFGIPHGIPFSVPFGIPVGMAFGVRLLNVEFSLASFVGVTSGYLTTVATIHERVYVCLMS